ncbi:hypothetical protein BSPP4475_17290 [Brevibacillus aydinogluensis]|jgi:hypothetical protein|uniref:Uncharacterized protein n=1 Tax=Brevibacillus aydinogluensis TaxID=927786 RepID=A0AA48MBB6_9BACL|nr:hypothetical protein BSPP4475_17290 [Brevibacillus aydinogluensis]
MSTLYTHSCIMKRCTTKSLSITWRCLAKLPMGTAHTLTLSLMMVCRKFAVALPALFRATEYKAEWRSSIANRIYILVLLFDNVLSHGGMGQASRPHHPMHHGLRLHTDGPLFRDPSFYLRINLVQPSSCSTFCSFISLPRARLKADLLIANFSRMMSAGVSSVYGIAPPRSIR